MLVAELFQRGGDVDSVLLLEFSQSDSCFAHIVMTEFVVVDDKNVEGFLSEVFFGDVVEGEVFVEFWIAGFVDGFSAKSGGHFGVGEDVEFAEGVGKAVDVHGDEVFGTVDGAVEGGGNGVVC